MTFADLGLDCDVVFEDVREVPRELWLKARQEGIGGSDAAATMGLSPFKSPFALYVDKVDEVPDEQTERMKRGQQMEDAIARMFLDEHRRSRSSTTARWSARAGTRSCCSTLTESCIGARVPL